jgi:putative ABC transport system ATP-binding protein
MDKQVILNASGIEKRFGSTPVLHGVNINLRESEILAVMGPSGSGKSTLLHCLAGIVRADKGIVEYMSDNIVTLSQSELAKLRRTDFGFIFQFSELMPELPVRENVALPLLLREVQKRRAYTIADEWLKAVNMTDATGKYPSMLSGGELQRVAIARAMAIDPKVIFADEPTGALDSLNSQKVMQLFVDLAKKHNKSVIIVTHSQELASYADRTIFIRDGVVDESMGKQI